MGVFTPNVDMGEMDSSYEASAVENEKGLL